MVTARKPQQSQAILIDGLWLVIGLLVAGILFVSISLLSYPKRLLAYFPPSLSHGGAQSGQIISKAQVYAFAFETFTTLSTWTNGGDSDYANNINAYRNELSASFYDQLMAQVLKRKQNGTLTRSRIVSGVSNMGYKASKVKILGDGTWQVMLRLNVIEMGDNQVIKNVIMAYPLLINQSNDSVAVNPSNLRIAGFASAPYRIKTIV